MSHQSVIKLEQSPDSGVELPSPTRASSSSAVASMDSLSGADFGDRPGASTTTQNEVQLIRKRVSNACEFCKTKKQRCTAERPCKPCIEDGRQCEPAWKADQDSPWRTVPESEVKDRECKIELRDRLLQEVHQRMLRGWDRAKIPNEYALFVEWVMKNPITPLLDTSVRNPSGHKRRRGKPRMKRAIKYLKRGRSMPTTVQDHPQPQPQALTPSTGDVEPLRIVIASPTHDLPRAQESPSFYGVTFMSQPFPSHTAQDPTFSYTRPVIDSNFHHHSVGTNPAGEEGLHEFHHSQEYGYTHEHQDYGTCQDYSDNQTYDEGNYDQADTYHAHGPFNCNDYNDFEPFGYHQYPQ